MRRSFAGEAGMLLVRSHLQEFQLIVAPLACKCTEEEDLEAEEKSGEQQQQQQQQQLSHHRQPAERIAEVTATTRLN